MQPKKTVRVHPDDVVMWASLTDNPMFSEAAKRLKALGGRATILWHRGAKELEVLPLEAPSIAIRRRIRTSQ